MTTDADTILRATAIGLMMTWYEGSTAVANMGGPMPLIAAAEAQNNDQWQRAIRHARVIIAAQAEHG